MIKKVTRIAIALVLALGLLLSSASVTLAKPQPTSEVTNLHLDGTALHFQLHLVNLNQAFSYKLSVARTGWTLFEDPFYALGRVSRNYTSPEIIRDLSSLPGWRGPRGKYEVKVELFNRRGISLGLIDTATYTFIFNVTFNETNNLSGVSIQLYNDAARTVPKGSALITDEFGETSSIAVEDETTYWYKATKTDYVDVTGFLIVNGSNLTVNFHMPCTYTVTFNATDDMAVSLSDVYIDIYSDSSDYMGYVTTNVSGQATMDLLEGTYYYIALKEDHAQSVDWFTVSGPAETVNITMEPLHTVTFEVVDGSTLDPVSNVEIDIYVGGEYFSCAVTDGNGEAAIGLVSGSYSYDVPSPPEGYSYMDGPVNFDVYDYDKTLDIELWTS